MFRSRLGLLGLCVMVLGLMAFMPSSASATPEWLILTSGGIPKTAAELPAEAVVNNETTWQWFLRLIGLEIKVSCTSSSVTGMKLETGGKLTNGSRFTLTGCTVPTPTGCTVKSAGGAVGTIATLELKGQLQTNGEILLEPKTGTVIAELVFEGASCPLPTGVNEPINGVIWYKDCEGKFATHLVKHLMVVSTEHVKPCSSAKTRQNI